MFPMISLFANDTLHLLQSSSVLVALGFIVLISAVIWLFCALFMAETLSITFKGVQYHKASGTPVKKTPKLKQEKNAKRKSSRN
jgi:choline-glycine betaine transporter